MRKIALTIVSLLFCYSLFAQSSIKGIITNKESNEIIAFANISLNNKTGTTTNDKGYFEFTQLTPGSYKISVSFVGFSTYTQNIELLGNETKELSIVLEPSNFLVEDVVITATKTENFINQIPTRINLISPRQIEAIAAQSTDELLMNVPGVNISRSFGIFSHSSTVTMRGLNGEEQGRVLVMIDGIPTNKSDGGSVNWNLLNPAQIERIEVVKGPGSSLYGGNAMGGAINIITKKPTESFSGKVSADYGTYNTMRGQVLLSGRLNENSDQGLYYNFSSFYRQSDGYITQSEADQIANPYIVESDLQEWAANAQVGYDINKNNGFEINLLYFDDDRATGEKVYQLEGNNREHDTYHIRANYFGEKNKLKWNVSMYYLNEDYKRISEWMKDDYTFYKVLSERIDMGVLSSASYQISNMIFTGGIDFKQGAVDAKDEYYTSTDIVFNRGKMNTFGLFLQDEISLLNDKLKVIAGLRFDYANFFDGGFEIENPTSETDFMLAYHNENLTKDRWNALSPKLSVQYNFSPSHRIYANYAKGFRPGVLDDMCRSGRIRGGFKVSDPTLQPEYINNFELGADSRFNKLRTSVSAYYSIGEDFMYYVNTGDSIMLSYGPRPIIKASNISKVEIYGLELEANYMLTKNIILNANYAYAHSQIKDYEPLSTTVYIDLTNNYLTDVPAHIVSASASWRNKIVNTSISAKYMSERWVNDLNEYDEVVMDDKYPSLTSVDLKLSKEIKSVFVNLSIQNIFDAEFYNTKGQVNPGRFISLELGTHF